jgi:hypothetical protein
VSELGVSLSCITLSLDPRFRVKSFLVVTYLCSSLVFNLDLVYVRVCIPFGRDGQRSDGMHMVRYVAY